MSVTEATPVTRPEVVVVTAADVLNRAADLLEEFGFCQHRLGSKAEGQMCAVGAMQEAAMDTGGFWLDAWALYFRRHGDPVSFNNAPGRTKAEVVAKLREAARAASR